MRMPRGVGAGRGTTGRNRPSGRTARLGYGYDHSSGTTTRPIVHHRTRVSVPLELWGASAAAATDEEEEVVDEVDRTGSGTSGTRAMRVTRVLKVRRQPRRRLRLRCRGVPTATAIAIVAAGRIGCAPPLLLSTSSRLTLRNRRWG